LELNFLSLLNFNLHVSSDLYESYRIGAEFTAVQQLFGTQEQNVHHHAVHVVTSIKERKKRRILPEQCFATQKYLDKPNKVRVRWPQSCNVVKASISLALPTAERRKTEDG
jgi:hypothetical protein